MNISSAYIFGKQLQSITPPIPANVYFENGQFNPDLAYENTSMNNMQITRGDYNDYNMGWGGDLIYSMIHADEGNGKIYQFLGANAGEYEISGGNIVCNIANPNTDSQTRFGTDYGAIWLPLRLPQNTYSHMFGRFKLSNRVDQEERYAIDMFMARPVPEYSRYNSSEYVYNWGDTVDVAFDIEANQGTWFDTATYIGISTGLFKNSEILKIWFT